MIIGKWETRRCTCHPGACPLTGVTAALPPSQMQSQPLEISERTDSCSCQQDSPGRPRSYLQRVSSNIQPSRAFTIRIQGSGYSLSWTTSKAQHREPTCSKEAGLLAESSLQYLCSMLLFKPTQKH